MRTKDAVTKEKLRGGFYSPDLLVDIALERVEELVVGGGLLRLLEPSVGDGAFLRGLQRHRIGRRIDEVVGVEILDEEADRAGRELERSRIAGSIVTANVLEWNQSERRSFDIAVGNPPYVRFQFLSPEDRQRAIDIGRELEVPGSAVSNLWIPVFLLSLYRLVAGGVFSMIVPMEFMTGVSASRVRAWLLENTCDLSVDLFEPSTFPAVLQEVVILSGRRAGGTRPTSSEVRFLDHNGVTKEWRHPISRGASTWTSYLLNAEQVAAWEHATQLSGVQRMSDVARFTVSTVTGANNFFCVDSSVAEDYELARWALPLLPRIKHAPGLVFEQTEHQALVASDSAAWLLSFAAGEVSPLDESKPSSYLLQGEAEGIHQRYKCRIREPWFRVPVVSPGTLLLSKRSDLFPRVIVNNARVVTTDTIYRGVVAPGNGLIPEDIAASFHNSLTLLSAEIRGRSFGGGVLELVPSEIGSLAIPTSPKARGYISMLDALSRSAPQGQALIDQTDKLMSTWLPGMTPELLDTLRSARLSLAARRTQRAHGTFYARSADTRA